MTQLFISHNSQDDAFVRDLRATLRGTVLGARAIFLLWLQSNLPISPHNLGYLQQCRPQYSSNHGALAFSTQAETRFNLACLMISRTSRITSS